MFYTLSRCSEGKYQERGSHFWAYAGPTKSRCEVEEFIRGRRAQHPHAHHVCYAFRVGDEKMCSDAGEPAHSAGAPILRVILSAQLTHATIVVARYFGGVKLGVPGLIRAYAAAAQNALDANEVVGYVPTRRVSIVFDYPQTAAVKKITNAFRVVESAYDERCRMIVEVPEFDWARVREMLRSRGIEYLTAGE